MSFPRVCQVFLGLLAAGFLGLGAASCSRDEPPAKPPVTILISPGQALSYSEQQAPYLRLRTSEMVLPGGWAAAMAPVLVDWSASSPDSAAGHYRVMNLNHGGSPIDGTTVLCSALVPAGHIKQVEFIVVPLDKLGMHGVMAHAMVRFIFADDSPLTLLDQAGAALFGDASVSDLILSWEAWRAPGVDYDAIAGLDPATYGLSLRAFSGPQRFLEDILQNRSWFAYPLNLPGGEAGNAELLRTMLALGDGTARRTLAGIYSRAEDDWTHRAPKTSGNTTDAQILVEALQAGTSAEDSLSALPQDELSYQTLQRSCATMALFNIKVAVARLVAPQHQVRLSLDQAIGPLEPWMLAAAKSGRRGLFLQSPQVLKYVMAHRQVVPTKIPGILDQSGLVQHQDGHALEIHYALTKVPPYGNIRDNLIR